MEMKTLLIIVISSLTMCCGCARESGRECVCGTENTGLPNGFMRVRVLDGSDDTPIEGACVVVPEADLICVTDARGLTETMELPCVVDAALDALCPYDEGRVTLIVYADGYIPYLLLYCRVLPGQERETPTVYMWPDDGSLPVFEVIEAPPLEWAAELVKMYEP